MASPIAGVVLPDRPLTKFEEHVYSLAQQFATRTDGEDVSIPTHLTLNPTLYITLHPNAETYN